MKATAAIAAAVVCLALGAHAATDGAWTRRSHDNQNTGNAGDDSAFSPDNVKDLKITQFFPTTNYVNATPIVVDGLLITGDWAGNVYVIDIASTAPLVKLATGGLTGPPPTGLVAELGTYAGMQSTPLVATVTVPDPTSPSGTRENKRLYVGVDSADKTLYCLDLDAIEPLRGTLDNNPGTDFFCASPGGNVWPRSLAADGPNGNKTLNGTMVFAKAHPVKDTKGVTSVHDVIYTATTGLDCANGQFWAIDAYTGELLWSFDPVVNGNGNGGTIWTTPAMSADGSLVYIATGDCVNQPQIGEKAESVVALDATDGHVVWWHQKRLADTADLDVGNGPLVADVPDAPGAPGCHVIVSTDKDGCIYGYQQQPDIPQVGDLGFDALRVGQQRVLYRQCFVPGSLNGGFNASNPGLWGRIAAQQTSGYPVGHVGRDDANAFGIDVCTGQMKWHSSSVNNGRADAAIASGMLFQLSYNRGNNSTDTQSSTTYVNVNELEVVSMADGTLLATLPITGQGAPRSPTLGGGGVAIVNGKLYIPTTSGIAVAEVVAGSGRATPVPHGMNIFLGPYPEPVAPGFDVLVPTVSDPRPLLPPAPPAP